MAKQLRVMLEVGPRQKRVVAVAPDWPGLERGDKNGEAAVERLRSYIPRYAKVPELADLGAEFAGSTSVDIVEEYPGTGSTDFWGISFAFSSIDRQEMSSRELERELALMRGCWAYFDDVRSRVSPEMEKGPRGGGRDRDQIVLHVLATEQDWANKLGAGTKQGERITDAKGLKEYREAYCNAIRTAHAETRTARTWPLRFLIRHTAYHSMDHAWEMEDKDVSAAVA